MASSASNPFRVEVVPPSASFSVRTQPVPLGAFPTSWQGEAKHIDMAYAGGRWYKMCGDHQQVTTPSPASQGGRQEIFSFTVPANDWRKEQDHYAPASVTPIQFELPDDAFCATRNNEIWVIRSTGNSSFGASPPGYAKLVLDHVMAWDITTKVWRDLGVAPNVYRGNRCWRMVYDSVTDKFFSFGNQSGLTIPMLRGSDGGDVTAYGSPGVPATYGNYGTAWLASPGFDKPNRVLYGWSRETRQIIRLNIDTLAVTVVTSAVPVPAVGAAIGQASMDMVWLPRHRALALFWVPSGGERGVMSLLQVDSNRWHTFVREDGYQNLAGHWIHGARQFFDPATEEILSIGHIDFDDVNKVPFNPAVYHRIKVLAL